jgi:hypothetical protein
MVLLDARKTSSRSDSVKRETEAGDEYGLSNIHIEVKAATSAYVVLGAPSLLMAIICGITAWKQPEKGAGLAGILFVVTLLWVLWVRGFRICITGQQLKYRDGFYRYITIPLQQVKEVKSTWVQWNTFGRHLKVPRLIVRYGAGDDFIVINPKPFRLEDLRRVVDVLTCNSNPNRRRE